MKGRPVAVVAGASRGLGFLLARELAWQGFDLVVCARSAEGIVEAAEALRREGATVSAVVADVSVRADADALVARAVADFNRLDVLVTNAGTIQVGPVAAMDVDDFAMAMDTMYWGVAYPALAAVPVMRRAGHGRIITVTSLGGKVPAPHLLPYAAAKHAAVGFSEGLCVELAKYGISVTTAVPGLMRTGSPDNALFKGNKTAEHAWFAIADSLPLLTMDAERAARAIVRAGLRGRSEIILTPAAQVAARVHGLLPELTTRALILVDRMLPANENSTAQPGRAVATDSALFRWLTTLTRQAASRWHETTDRTRADGKPEIHRGADRSD